MAHWMDVSILRGRASEASEAPCPVGGGASRGFPWGGGGAPPGGPGGGAQKIIQSPDRQDKAPTDYTKPLKDNRKPRQTIQSPRKSIETFKI